MSTITCDACGSSFPLERAKNLKDCPVCGEALWNDDAESSDNTDSISDKAEIEDSLMYFDEIMIFKNEPEYNNVCVYCGECGKNNPLELDKFDQLVDKEYVVLKPDVLLKCKGCGKEHKPRKILYKRKDHYYTLPRCPICNSAMLKKIKTSSKILAAATLGTFALPYNSKTYECQNCHYLF